MTQLEQYLLHLSTIKNLSANTLTAYRKDMERFLLFCPNFTGAEIDAWRAMLAEMAPITHARNLSSAKGFTRWLVGKGLLEADPLFNSEPPRGQHRIRPHLTMDEIKLFLGVILAEKKHRETSRKDYIRARAWINERDYAIFLTLFTSGLRRAELCDLNRSDVILDGKCASLRVVQGKGAKDRIVPLMPKTLDALEAVKNHPRPAGLDALFVTGKGRISGREIDRLTKAYGEKAGLPSEKCHPHAFRRGTGTFLHEHGLDILDVSRILGHSDVKTTQRYIGDDRQELNRRFQEAWNGKGKTL